MSMVLKILVFEMQNFNTTTLSARTSAIFYLGIGKNMVLKEYMLKENFILIPNLTSASFLFLIFYSFR
jgi:hypothetical protein